MTNEQVSILLSAFSINLKPLDTRPLYEWLKDNVPLPNVYNPPGTFDISFYPYLKRPMEDLSNDEIKQVNLASCVQAGKSLLQQLYLPYIILEAPGPVLMVHDTAENAKRCVEERIIPLLKNNPDTKLFLDSDRFNARQTGVKLPHMTFRVSGPAESNILAYSARVVLGDEVWRWQADHHVDTISKLKARTVAFNATKKIIFASQPDYEGSDWHKECMRGLWYDLGFKCPKCGILQQYEWQGGKGTKEEPYFGMVFDPTEEKGSGGKDYDKKAKSARLVCKHCFHEIHDTQENRKALVDNGDYILIHEGTDHSVHTYSWGQWVNRSVSFKEISIQYFDAVLQKRNENALTKHQLFRQQILGKFWKSGQVVETRKLFTEAYKSSDEWPEETIRFLTIDVQKDYLYWLIRAWSAKVPECRLIDWGTCAGFGEIEEIATKYKVDPLCIGVDSGNDTREVYKESCQRSKVKIINGRRVLAQWVCLRGDGGSSPLTPKKFYKHKIEEHGKQLEIDRLYSPVQYVDCQWATDSKFKPLRATLYNWSNYSVKKILQGLRDKQLPFNWKLNERANSDYTQQIFSEELSAKTGRFEKINDKNHIWDCECMQLVMSLMAGCYCPSPSEMNTLVQTQETESKPA